MSTNDRLTDSTPMGAQLAGTIPTSAATCINVCTGAPDAGRFKGQRVVQLRGFKRLEAGGWGYDGRELLIPVEHAGELVRLILQAADC